MQSVLLGISVIVALLAGFCLIEAFRLPQGTLAEPGPGLYPRIVGILLLAGAAGVFLESVVGRVEREPDWPGGAGLRRMAALLGTSLGYVLLAPYIGHPLTASFVTLVVLRLMGLRRWVVVLGLAFATGFGSYYLIGLLLGVPLPAGALFE